MNGLDRLAERADDEQALAGDPAALLRALVRHGGAVASDDPGEEVVRVRLPAPLWAAVQRAVKR